MLPSLVDVFEEDPVVEAAAIGALAARFRHDILPAHVMGRGESLEYFQNVGQFRGQLPVRRRLRFMRLLQQLGPRGRLATPRSPTSEPAGWPSITCSRPCSRPGNGKTVTCTRSGISSWGLHR